LQHIRRRGLPLQRFPGFVEQPRVLDRDHRLIGESSQEIDLALREGAFGSPHQRDRADRAAFLQHRHRHDAADLHDIGHVALVILGVGPDVGYLLDLAAQDRTARTTAPTGAHRIEVLQGLDSLARVSVRMHEMDEFAVEAEDVAERGLAEASRALGDRLEHRLHVGWRICDDLQYLGRSHLLLAGLLQLFGHIGDRRNAAPIFNELFAAAHRVRLSGFRRAPLASRF